MSDPSSWLPIARLLRPQGRRGELLADPLTDLAEVFTDGREVFLSPAGSASSDPVEGGAPVQLESHFFPTGRNAGRIVLKLSNSGSISDAEALAGRTISIPASEAPALEADTYFVRDLLGCVLYNGDAPAGVITDVEFATGPDGRTRLEDAAPLLVVQPSGQAAEGGDTVLVPLIRAWINSVDLPAKRISMTLPEGLLDPAE